MLMSPLDFHTLPWRELHSPWPSLKANNIGVGGGRGRRTVRDYLVFHLFNICIRTGNFSSLYFSLFSIPFHLFFPSRNQKVVLSYPLKMTECRI